MNKYLSVPLRFILYYILGILGILGVSVAPQVLSEKGLYNFVAFIEEFLKFTIYFADPANWEYNYKGQVDSLFNVLWEPYLYSMTIILGAIALGLVLAVIFAVITFFLPTPISSMLKKILNFMESVPDLLFAFLLQLFIVFFFKKYGIMLMEFTEFDGVQIYGAPIFTLAIVPMVSFFRILLLVMEEEMVKDHIEFARSKGLSKSRILFSHVMKNITPSSFYHGKLIIWGTLSSLFIIETLFDMKGITFYITQDFRPVVIAYALILLFTPFFFIYQGVYLWMNRAAVIDDSHYRIKKDKVKFSEWKIWGFIATSWRAWKVHMKNPKFAGGFIIIFGMIVYSFCHSLFKDEPVSKLYYVKDDDGTLISVPPHAPSEFMALGSDYNGFSILDQLIVGAKYTLIFALVVALLRVIGGFYLGVGYHFFLNERRKNWVNRIVDSIHFLPLSLIAYLLLRPVLWGLTFEGFQHSLFERLVFEAIVLTILVLPLTMVLIGNELKLIGQQDFVVSAKLLGGSNRHLLWTHLFPHLAPRMFILFGQQFIQTMLILVHMGLFYLFLGGTIVSRGLLPDPPKSATFEWSGLISSSKEALMTEKYWIVLFPLFAFMIAIFAMQLVVQGVKEIQQAKVGVRVNKKPIKGWKKWSKSEKAKVNPPLEGDFTLTHQNIKG
ncbi:ABC transporter permease subunit [Rossellomorea marisflavi]|uniref:ABC transporter permease subunit n=1 Tax=Rossellomorea marisflavi TaxID=189381 RepID=UPI00064FE70E|nr:ABC transporter permease subunit [Rossellomorea marisflavi]KML01834.1 hypothetical protein VL06_17990 [Rossellomorea marisflavi]QHA34614.1 ABC transporter permease subunit [Rossellomorea marisflavi]